MHYTICLHASKLEITAIQKIKKIKSYNMKVDITDRIKKKYPGNKLRW